jgi:eukaryotic-like serine/threonine-protein kinase
LTTPGQFHQLIINFDGQINYLTMSLLSFIKSKTFRYHFLLALAAGIAFLWFSFKALDVYTRHGRTIEVPDLSGMNKEEAHRALKKIDLRMVINDSIFDTTREKGSVASQNPAAGAEVKKNRAIYLTTVAVLPEMVAMPDLTDLSFRQAQALLLTYGLEVGQLDYVANIARNAVLQQKYNNGTIQPGTLVEKGTRINLVLGTGVGSSYVNVPLVIGRPRDEAIRLINSSSLNIGQEVFLDETEENLMVYRQSPNVLNRPQKVAMGSTVDLYYRSSDNFDFQEYAEEVLGVPTPNLLGKTPLDVFEILEEQLLVLGEEVFEDNSTTENARVIRQSPDPTEQPNILRGTQIDIWYGKP